MINPVFLRTFMKLVQTKHFTHTAERLNMTQPGVSQHIKKLEAQFGKQLLNRNGKAFELTAAGESLFQYGLQVAEAESELLKTLAGDDINAGDCKLACSGSIAMQLYPELLNLQKRLPGLTISIKAAPNAEIVEQIRRNQADLGIVTQPVNDPKLMQEKLGEDPLYLVVPAEADSTWQALMQLGFINHPDGFQYAIELLEVNYPDEFQSVDQIPHSGYINQLSQVLLPVSMGLGFTIIPQSSLDAFPNPDLIRSVELNVFIKETVYLTSKKNRTIPSRYQLIKDLLTRQWN